MEARWVALAGGVVIESIAGSPYAFGVWEPALKAQLNYTQAEIETVGSVGNFGQYTGEPVAEEALPHPGPAVDLPSALLCSLLCRARLRCVRPASHWHRGRAALCDW